MTRMQETCTIIKVIRKVRKRWHRNPLFGMRFQKKEEKEYTGLQRGMKLSLAANLVLN
jgi:hypothetical protein